MYMYQLRLPEEYITVKFQWKHWYKKNIWKNHEIYTTSGLHAPN